MLGVYSDWISDGNFIVMEVMGCQVHAIGKGIRPPFADPVTLCMNKLMFLCFKNQKNQNRFVKSLLAIAYYHYLYHKNSSDYKATH